MSICSAPTLKRRVGWILLMGLLCGMISAAIYVRNVTKPRATPPPPVPVPNAYDNLLIAAIGVTNSIPNQGNTQVMKLEELKAFVEENSPVLIQGRSLMGNPSRVPLVYEKDFDRVFKRMSALRVLARLFAAEGELAFREGRFEDAGRSFLDLNQFGPAIGRGGIWIDVLVGVAVETSGQIGFRRILPHLGKEKLREALVLLREVDRNRETFSEVKNTEEYWSEQTQPFYVLFMIRASGPYDKLIEPTHKAGEAAILRVQTANRHLQLDIARQLYKLDHGQESDDPGQLTPNYIPEIPKNSKTGMPISGGVDPPLSQP